jgi:hypothetical protein
MGFLFYDFSIEARLRERSHKTKIPYDRKE